MTEAQMLSCMKERDALRRLLADIRVYANSGKTKPETAYPACVRIFNLLIKYDNRPKTHETLSPQIARLPPSYSYFSYRIFGGHNLHLPTLHRFLQMNTYYIIHLTQAQRDTLLSLATIGSVDQQDAWEYAPSHPTRKAHEDALAALKNAPQHPNVEDVYMHDAQHSGFTAGEKVLLECKVVATSDHVSTLNVRHLAAVTGEEIMVANNLIHHMEA